jgi:hypothetical protein
LVRKVLRASRVILVHKDLRELKVLKDRKVKKDRKDHKVR